MTTEIETWQREHYVAGGGDPMLFYVVYGEIDASAPLSRSRYRSSGAPDGIDVMSYGPNKHPDLLGSFRDGYLWDEFVARDPKLAATVEQSEHCIILRGTPNDSTTLNYLRDTVGLITYLLDHGGCAVYDPLMFRWWGPSEWKQQIFDPAASVPHNHTVILVSQEEDPSLKWFHTRGMRKFGRPDISVHDVSSNLEDGVIDLCNRLIEHQAFGHVVRDGQQVKMASLPSGGVIRHRGDLDDPDFNNVHLDVSWRDV
ncbi:MAG: hypothetical protein U1A77_26280 [Pirellulales bacterium]